MVTGRRDTTTVATQALYLLNDPFVREQSLALAERLLGTSRRSTTRPGSDLAYRLTARPAGRRRAEVDAGDGVSSPSTRRRTRRGRPSRRDARAERRRGRERRPAAAQAPRRRSTRDEVDQTDEPVVEEVVRPPTPGPPPGPASARPCSARAEFRYVR